MGLIATEMRMGHGEISEIIAELGTGSFSHH